MKKPDVRIIVTSKRGEEDGRKESIRNLAGSLEGELYEVGAVDGQLGEDGVGGDVVEGERGEPRHLG